MLECVCDTVLEGELDVSQGTFVESEVRIVRISGLACQLGGIERDIHKGAG